MQLPNVFFVYGFIIVIPLTVSDSLPLHCPTLNPVLVPCVSGLVYYTVGYIKDGRSVGNVN